MKSMKVKVCGITEQANYDAISNQVSMIGFNFYRPSKRFIGMNTIVKSSNAIHVGVFVNAPLDEISIAAKTYALDYIQCHGGESIDYCKKLSEDFKIIKVFSIANEEDLSFTKDFAFCDYFLFDTKTKDFGGSGQKFDWTILDAYDGDVPFLLAGGLGPQDAAIIKNIDHAQFAGIDINSKFETQPGIKDIDMINAFLLKLDLENLKAQNKD